MAVLVNKSYVQASTNLATDLARYGSGAEWRGIYYRDEKIGFTVSQTIVKEDGFELEEDGRLQMSLLGATTAATLRTTARVDRAFALRSFEFSLDPGTGAIQVRGQVDGLRLQIAVTTPSGTRTEERVLTEPLLLSLNMPRRLASEGLRRGAHYQWMVFDPATLSNARVVVDVGARELVRIGGRPLPAFRVETEFSGIHTTSWVTDTGDVVREESPMGLITVRESPERARAMAVPFQIRKDLMDAAAVVPDTKRRIDDPRDVRMLRLRLDGMSSAIGSSADLQGVGQSVDGDIVELRETQSLKPGPSDPEAAKFLAPEAFIESDAPEIVAEAAIAVQGVTGSRARVERLTRYVNSILEKKPTVSLPSAREVLRTRVGDCNEHTALYVAMARALGIPARIAVGLVYVRGAFYYHAWPEVYVDEGKDRGLWLAVDPTLNQFPADVTHLRLARGGLEKQAVILPLIGRLKMTVLDMELTPGSTPTLVGRRPNDTATPLSIPLPQRSAGGCCACWSSPVQGLRGRP